MSNLSDFIGADPQGIVKLPAGVAISANDVILNNENGKASILNAAMALAFENNTTAGMSAVKALYAVENSNANYGYSTNNAQRVVCELGNGNIAQVFSGNGSNNVTNVNIRIKTPLGANVVDRITIATGGAGVYSHRIYKLNSTQFVVAWGVSVSAGLKFSIYNNDGSVAVAPVVVSTLTSYSPDCWNMAITTAGEIVFAYQKASPTDMCFKRYNAAGTLQGSETVVEAGAAPYNIAVLGCANGDFVISYYRGTATTAYKFARYNASGTIQGSLTTLVTTGNQLNTGDFTNGLVELSGGNIVFATPRSGDTFPQILVFSNTNTLIRTIDFGSSVHQSSEVPCLVPTDSGGFAVIGRRYDTNGSWFSSHAADGLEIVPRISFDTGVYGAAQYGSGISAFSLGAAGFAVFRSGYNNGPQYDVTISTISPSGVLVGSEVVLVSPGGASIGSSGAILTSGNYLVFSYVVNAGNYLSSGTYNVARKSIIGVALNSVAKGSLVSVATKGSYTVNQQSLGGSFDNRAATVPGTRGVLTGSTAVLFGMQP